MSFSVSRKKFVLDVWLGSEYAHENFSVKKNLTFFKFNLLKLTTHNNNNNNNNKKKNNSNNNNNNNNNNKNICDSDI